MSLPQHRAPLLVLGCHRSGTSAVTGLLHRATGIHLGEMLPPTRDNPVGYFESPAIQVGHDLLLHALDRDWTCPPSRFDSEAVPRDVLAEQVKRLAKSAQPWAVKDPRMLFMLPAWLDLIEEFRFVGVVRSPAAIALSITTRDKIPEEAAGRIAEIHLERLASLHRKLGFPIVDFSEPSSATVDRVRAVASGLGLSWDENEAATFLQPSMIHHRSHHQDPNPDHRYLVGEAAAPIVEVSTFTAAEVRSALESIPPRSAMADPTNLGPRFSERRSELWDQFTDEEDIDRVIDLLPDGTPPRPIRPRDVDYSFCHYRSPRDVGRRLARRPASSHIVAAGLLEAVPPSDLVRVLRDLSRYSQSFAEVALDGFIIEESAETVIWQRGDFVTTVTGPSYHHTKDSVGAAATQTGWTCDLEAPDPRGRTAFALSKDPDLALSSLPDGGQTTLLSIEARLAALERDIHRTEPNRTEKKKAELRSQLDRKASALTRAQSKKTKAEERKAELRSRLDDKASALASIEESLAFAMGRAARLEVDLLKERQEISEVRDELQKANTAIAAERERYARLSGRRLVRLALAMARPARPLFRAVRRLRRPRQLSTGGSSASTAKDPDASSTPPTQAVDVKPTSADDDFVARLASRPPVTIIVPVHNAVEDLRQAMASIARNTPGDTDVLLIDDASSDPDVAPYLAEVAAWRNVTVLHNDRNLGFAGTVNRGIQVTTGDVVVLNSDVEVTPGWLRNLTAAAYRDDRIATATPLSDNAGAFSVPKRAVRNSFPSHLTRDQVGRLVSQHSHRTLPATPTANGFCMYMKRSALDSVGPLDSEAFPRGYGEENDFCMRAIRNGWQHVVDDATLIFHARGASFGDDRKGLINSGRAVLDARYPDYTARVHAFLSGSEMSEVRQHVAEVFDAATQHRTVPHPRVLYVIFSGTGGTPATNLDLMGAIEDAVEPLVLTSDRRTVNLYRMEGGESRLIDSLKLDSGLWAPDMTSPAYRAWVGRVLVEHSIDMVHIRHLIMHPLDLPDLARALGIPVVLSLHDFYYICPSVHLVDNNGKWCAGSCTSGDGVCDAPSGGPDMPHLKHAWVHEWRAHTKQVLANVDHLVTTTSFSRDLYLEVFPEIAATPFEVIEHGRDLEQLRGINETPTPGGKIRIAVLGNMGRHKGVEFARRILSHDDDDRLELHVFGSVPLADRDIGVMHGTYERETLPARLAEIGPHFVGLLSIWGETYSHTLTEAWACGIPVIASKLGALGQRVSDRGGGWLVDPDDPRGAVATIYAAADDTEGYERESERTSIDGLPSTTEMAADYVDLYWRTFESFYDRGTTLRQVAGSR